jgi:hypothetical protein
MGKWTDGNWYSNDSYKQYNDYKYYGNVKVSNTKGYTAKVQDDFDKFDDWDYTKGWDTTTTTTTTTTEVIDEWEMYEELCDIYGLDPNEDATWEQMLDYMEINQAEDISELYDLVLNYMN